MREILFEPDGRVFEVAVDIEAMTPIYQPVAASRRSAWLLCFRAGYLGVTLVQSVATQSYVANGPEARFSGGSTFKRNSDFPAFHAFALRIAVASSSGSRGSKVMGTKFPRTKETK